MREFIRPIHKHIKDLFIPDIETLCDFADELKYHIPDSLRESKFHATHSSILKESANGLVVGETSCRREQVVLQGCDGGHGNLRAEETKYGIFIVLEMNNTPEKQLLDAKKAYDAVKDNPDNPILLVCIDTTPKPSASNI